MVIFSNDEFSIGRNCAIDKFVVIGISSDKIPFVVRCYLFYVLSLQNSENNKPCHVDTNISGYYFCILFYISLEIHK